ncbi:MAG: class I SAM-dependent methyltransferase [Isosphaeraceae bacterium]|nr:class I SAM-dependent methyltransferase [Isosphaeraceae bacterium]
MPLRTGLPLRILEVASHGGYLQEAFRVNGAPTTIVEGSTSWADDARRRGLAVERTVLDAAAAPRLIERLGGRADAVLDFYLLAHLRDPGSLLLGIRRVLGADGFAVVEFDHLLPLIKQRQFDAIRHGHFSYFSLLAFRAALDRAGLEVFDVEKQPVYGGALRAWLRDARHGPQASTARVETLLAEERQAGLDRVETYLGFHEAVELTQQRLRGFLEQARRDGRLVVGYGAPSRCTTLLNSCGITSELLPFVVDRSPAKQGRSLPGSRIPIREPDALLRARPDIVLVLTWDLIDEVMAQLPEVRSWGGRFVVPIPEVSVLP